jgi:hypothetical protein
MLHPNSLCLVTVSVVRIRFARAMQRLGISIEALVTVDVKGLTDGVIPSNVKNAANYYERWLYPLFYPVYYGKKNFHVEDSGKTKFFGSVRIQHAGHFRIVSRSPARQLLCDAVGNAYESELSRNHSFQGNSP